MDNPTLPVQQGRGVEGGNPQAGHFDPVDRPCGLRGRTIARVVLGLATITSSFAISYLHTAARCHTSLNLSGLFSCGVVPGFVLDLPYSDLHTYTLISAGVLVTTALYQLVL